MIYTAKPSKDANKHLWKALKCCLENLRLKLITPPEHAQQTSINRSTADIYRCGFAEYGGHFLKTIKRLVP